MKHRFLTVLAASVLFLSVQPAMAQDADSVRVQLAEELLKTMHMDTALAESVDGMLQMQLQASPQMAPFADIMRTFLMKHMSFEALRPGMTAIYAQAFTAAELREIVSFYKTETGQKTARLMPMLMQQGAALGQAAVQEHMPELESLLSARAAELEAQP